MKCHFSWSGEKEWILSCGCVAKKYIFDVIIIIVIIFINNAFVVVMVQSRQVIETSFDCCWYSGGALQSLDCWSSSNVQGKMGAGGIDGVAVAVAVGGIISVKTFIF